MEHRFFFLSGDAEVVVVVMVMFLGTPSRFFFTTAPCLKPVLLIIIVDYNFLENSVLFDVSSKLVGIRVKDTADENGYIRQAICLHHPA